MTDDCEQFGHQWSYGCACCGIGPCRVCDQDYDEWLNEKYGAPDDEPTD